MVKKYKRIDRRIEELEDVLIGTPRPVCEMCGAEGGGQSLFEYHHTNGTVEFEPHPPCPGCEALAPPGRISRVVFCSLHTYGLSCPMCQERGGENPEYLALVRERYLTSHPEERRDI